MRPVLRYHGGKWRIAPWIIDHFPPHRIYCEPFGGAASVLMRKPRSFAEVYNDLDLDVVNVFRVMRDRRRAARLREVLHLTPWSRAEFMASYEPARDPVEQARRTIVRCFFGHGGTSRRMHRTGFRAKCYRQNQTGVSDWVKYPDEIDGFVERLRGVTIEAKPAVEIIRQQDSCETLIYADPPYPFSTRTSKRGGDKNAAYAVELTDDHHRDLAEVLRGAAAMVVLSGYRCDLYDRELYSDWRSVEKSAQADGAIKRTEVLWMNAAAWAHQARLF